VNQQVIAPTGSGHDRETTAGAGLPLAVAAAGMAPPPEER
jgi:hypothetical protein